MPAANTEVCAAPQRCGVSPIALLRLAGLLGAAVAPLRAAVPPDHGAVRSSDRPASNSTACTAICPASPAISTRYSKARRAIAASATSPARRSTRRRSRRTHIASTNNCAACHDTIVLPPERAFRSRRGDGQLRELPQRHDRARRGTDPSGHQPGLRGLPYGRRAGIRPRPSITPRFRWRWPASASSATTACRPPASPRDTSPPTWSAAIATSTSNWLGATFDHTGITHRLRQLPQRHQSGGQAGQPHAHHQRVRELPYHRHRHQDAELGALGIRSHADDGHDLPDLSQRQRQDLAPASCPGSRSITCRRFPH